MADSFCSDVIISHVSGQDSHTYTTPHPPLSSVSFIKYRQRRSSRECSLGWYRCTWGWNVR